MIDLSLNDKEKENLTEDEIEIAMARKLEILILPQLRRNIKFFYAGGDLKGKANAYREKMNKEEFEKYINSNKKDSIATVCKPLCDMVASILQENGINAEPVSCDTDIFRHTDVLITTKSGKKYIINYLEDMEAIQTGMRTPDFASKPYYERRYKKFENSVTTDGKNLEGIDFIPEDKLDLIDKNIGYKKYNMYMDTVINQIKEEFENFKEIMKENELLTKKMQAKKSGKEITEDEVNEIYNRYNNMTKEEELEEKLDWIFKYFNDRMDIKGHTDFVMYYSRLLLKQVLTQEEYNMITRYEGFAKEQNIPEDSIIKNVIDYENSENNGNIRICMIQTNKKTYVFSTKPNEYIKLDNKEMEEIKKYFNISKSEKPSDLMLYLCDRGNALPLVFHPLGSKILNERAELIDKNLSDEDRLKAVKDLSDNIKTTDEPVTSILIPYPDGTEKYLYINENDEFVIREKEKETIYHYDEKDDSFMTEEKDLDER